MARVSPAPLCELVARFPRVVDRIFVLLNPSDLKSARLVCKDLDKYIKDEVWGSVWGRNQLSKKLERRWKEVMPWRREISIGGDFRVITICCNDRKMAVFVEETDTGDEHLRIYNLSDLAMEYQIRTKTWMFDGSSVHLKTDMGQDILATFNNFEVCVWRMSTKEALSEVKVNGIDNGVHESCIKVWLDNVYLLRSGVAFHFEVRGRQLRRMRKVTLMPTPGDFHVIFGTGMFLQDSQPMSVSLVKCVHGGARNLWVTNLTTGKVVNMIVLNGAYRRPIGFAFEGGDVICGFSDASGYVLWYLPDLLVCQNEAQMWSKSIETSMVLSSCAINKTMTVSWSVNHRTIIVDDFWLEKDIDATEVEEGKEMTSQTVDDGEVE